MSIRIPSGALAQFRPLTDDQILTSSVRVSGFRFELLDRNEIKIADLIGVEGGSLDWTYNASIKGGGSITVSDLIETVTGNKIDWLNVRIRPLCIIEGFSRAVPVGIWLAAAPVENWDETGRSWEVELLDKACILDQDIYSDPATGDAVTFQAIAGQNVVELVRLLITQTGESAAAIQDDDQLMAGNMVWDVGTTRLRIINDLLDAAGFYSIWVDNEGQFRVSKSSGDDRGVVYEAVGPFESGPNSVMAEGFQVDRDIYAIPNRVLAISQGDEETAALTATAVNTDPDSEFSYLRRGRWVTAVETDVDVVSQAALQAYVDRKMQQLSSVSATIPVSHAYLPDLRVGVRVWVKNPRAGILKLMQVSKTTVVFDPTEFCTSDLREWVSTE